MEKQKYLQQIKVILHRITKHKDFPFFLAGACILLFFAFKSSGHEKSDRNSSSGQASHNGQSHGSVDTYIPEGFVLIPIEVANLAHLNQIMGAQAVVDLYALTVEGQRAKKPFASKVKVVRAPQNENVLAVLTPEDKAPDILNQPGPFFVALQNPKFSGTSSFESKPTTKRDRKTHSRIVPTDF